MSSLVPNLTMLTDTDRGSSWLRSMGGQAAQFIRECKDYLSDLDYDYLHCHDLDGIIAGWFISKKGAALVFDMHEFYEVNGPRRQRLRYLVRAVVKFFQNRSDYIIYVNEAQAKHVSRRNSKKLVFLPNYPEQKMYAGCQKSHPKN